MSAYRNRFNLAHDPLPRDASGKTCFADTHDFEKLRRVWGWLAAEPGLGCGDAETLDPLLVRAATASDPADVFEA